MPSKSVGKGDFFKELRLKFVNFKSFRIFSKTLLLF